MLKRDNIFKKYLNDMRKKMRFCICWGIFLLLLQCLQIESFNDNTFVSFNWKRSVFIPIPKKGNDKECSNCCTIALITHASKVILKILQDRFTCLLWNLYGVQETTVRTGHGTMDWLKIGKGVRQGCILSLWLFNLYMESVSQFSSVAQSCPTLWDPMNRSMPGFPVHHQFL